MGRPRRAIQNLYASTVLVITPGGILLIRDPNKPKPHFWKCPGGASKIDPWTDVEETPEECARRELFEQTGITITSADTFVKLISSNRITHEHVSYVLILSYVPELKHGRKGEEVVLFKASEILKMDGFFLNHRHIYEEVLKETSVELEHS